MSERDTEVQETHQTDVLTAFEGDTGGPSRIQRIAGRYVPAAILFIGVLVVWEGLTRGLDVESFVLPKPSQIVDRFFDNSAEIWSAGWETLKEALAGLLVGGTLAIASALATVRWAAVREGLMPFSIAANSVPIIALAPIANAMFSLTSPVSKAAVVAVVVYFPIMINTARGLVEVDPGEIELMRSYGASQFSILRRVRAPNALPYFFSALKVATALSIIAAIVSEYFGGPQGVLGQYIINRAQLFLYPEAWAAIIVASILGIGLYTVVLVAERLAMPWHVSFRGTEGP